MKERPGSSSTSQLVVSGFKSWYTAAKSRSMSRKRRSMEYIAAEETGVLGWESWWRWTRRVSYPRLCHLQSRRSDNRAGFEWGRARCGWICGASRLTWGHCLLINRVAGIDAYSAVGRPLLTSQYGGLPNAPNDKKGGGGYLNRARGE